MKDITSIDKNFIIESIDKEDLKIYDTRKPPFKIYGFYEPESDKVFRRIPESIAAAMSDGALWLHTHTTGIRVRFKTNSPYVAIKAKFNYPSYLPHMTATGSAGFDLYADGKFVSAYTTAVQYDDKGTGSFAPADKLEGIVNFPDSRMRDIIINFPVYSGVDSLLVGLSENAELLCGNEYKITTPIVYYGSSITHGGCASRPGNTYPAIISRKLDCDFINLGFSGNARAEEAIAEYIADLDMSVFVYDYDHNAPTIEHLEKTHKPMFDKIRAKNPTLPIIMASRPNTNTPEEIEARKEIIYNTYKLAKASGDENVYFIDGQELLNYKDAEIMTCDGCHPNDFGFWCMAEVIGGVIKEILEKNE